jgi:hypothetical protein
MPKPKTEKKSTPRTIANAQRAEEKKKRKLHVIAERRAKAQKMSKAEYIAAIVAGRFPGITQEDIAAEDDPGVEAATPAAEVEAPDEATAAV